MSSSMVVDGGGGVGAFDPSGLPVIDDAGRVRAAAGVVTTAVGAVASTVGVARSQWCSLAGVYVAPEAAELVAVMDRPVSVADDLVAKQGRAGEALLAYADRLEELQRRRDDLQARMWAYNAAAVDYQVKKAACEPKFVVVAGGSRVPAGQDTSAIDGLARDLARTGEAIENEAAQLAEDVVAADIACGNAISAIFFGTHYSLGGRTSVDDPHQVGSTAGAIVAQARRGESPWGVPVTWSDGTDATDGDLMVQGVKDAVVGSVVDVGALLGIGDAGEVKAAKSGLWRFAQDVSTFVNPTTFVGAFVFDRQGLQASGERLWAAGSSVVDVDLWRHSPASAEGQLYGNVLLGVATEGAGGVAVKGVGVAARAGIRGARSAALRMEDVAAKLANMQFPVGPPAVEVATVGPVLGAATVKPFAKPAASLTKLNDLILQREVMIDGVSERYSARDLGTNM